MNETARLDARRVEEMQIQIDKLTSHCRRANSVIRLRNRQLQLVGGVYVRLQGRLQQQPREILTDESHTLVDELERKLLSPQSEALKILTRCRAQECEGIPFVMSD